MACISPHSNMRMAALEVRQMKPGHASWITYCVVCSAACTNNGSGRPRKVCSQTCKNKHTKNLYRKRYVHRDRAFRRDYDASWLKDCKIARGNCMDCGYVQDERTSRAFDWDHRDPSAKCFEISNIPARTSKQQIIAEMNKCDVICRNCHALRPTSFLGTPKRLRNKTHRQLDLGGLFGAA